MIQEESKKKNRSKKEGEGKKNRSINMGLTRLVCHLDDGLVEGSYKIGLVKGLTRLYTIMCECQYT